MHPYFQTLLTAMTPVGELRLSIPIALGKLGLSVPEAYLISIIGNLVPVIFLLLFLHSVSLFLIRHSRFFELFFSWFFERTRRRVETKYRVLGYLALVLFVAMPLPVTGAWTGSAAAYLLGIPFWKAFGLITVGVLIAGLLVTLASVGVITIL